MNKHLTQTLQRHYGPLHNGDYIDAYNRIMRQDGLSGVITSGVNFRNDTWVVVNG